MTQKSYNCAEVKLHTLTYVTIKHRIENNLCWANIKQHSKTNFYYLRCMYFPSSQQESSLFGRPTVMFECTWRVLPRNDTLQTRCRKLMFQQVTSSPLEWVTKVSTYNSTTTNLIQLQRYSTWLIRNTATINPPPTVWSLLLPVIF